MVTEEEGEGYEPTQTTQKSLESSDMIHLRPGRTSIILFDAMKIFICTLSPPVSYFLCQDSRVNTQEKDGNFRESNTVM
jgi:hypothetical protein